MKNDISKYTREGGIHRVPLWRIAGFALNNTATNLYLVLMTYVAYYLIGFVGAATILASSFSTIMRLWDGVTDPFIGYMVDKTDGKFGKNRPFMVIGQAILFVSSFIMFHVTHKLPENGPIRMIFFVVIALIYYIGYTFQCVVTKSAQSALTNDPKQRPLFAVFDAAYNTVLFTVTAILATKIYAKYGTFYDVRFFHEFWLILAVFAALFTAIAVISIWPKDRTEFFGTGKAVMIKPKDYWDTFKNNRAIQMLVVAASTDKLASTAKTSAVTAVLWGVVAGNYALYGTMTGLTSIPGVILTVLVIGGLATTLGQRKGMIIGSVGGIVTGGILAAMWLFANPSSMNGADGSLQWGYFAILYIILTIIYTGFTNLAGNIVIPMTADCADYEVYRSGKYVPGMMGTLFSLVDKLISSIAPLVAGLLFAAIGFADALPEASTPYSVPLHVVAVFLTYGLVMLGQICNLIAMKYYPLTKEKMEEIREEINAIKEKAAAKAQ